MNNMNDEKLFKKAKEKAIKTRIKTKNRSIRGGTKVRISNCISILDDSIFVKFQLLNKYSKGV